MRGFTRPRRPVFFAKFEETLNKWPHLFDDRGVERLALLRIPHRVNRRAVGGDRRLFDAHSHHAIGAGELHRLRERVNPGMGVGFVKPHLNHRPAQAAAVFAAGDGAIVQAI